MGKSDFEWMEVALDEAREAAKVGDVPVGALVVRGNRILGRGHNQVEALHDPSAHAEIVAIRAASSALRYERLTGCTLYVSMEPCAMCAGAAVLARLDRLVFGTPDPKAGACGSLLNVVRDKRLNHCVEVTRGVRSSESEELIKGFFENLRTH